MWLALAAMLLALGASGLALAGIPGRGKPALMALRSRLTSKGLSSDPACGEGARPAGNHGPQEHDGIRYRD